MAGNLDSPLLTRNENRYLETEIEINDPEGDFINETGNMSQSLPRTERRTSKQLKEWHLNYQEAAIYLQEGENNDKYYTHPQNHEALPAYQIAHNKFFYLLDLAAALLILSLAACERPAYHYFQLPVGVHGSLEIFGLLLLGLELAFRMKWLGLRTYLHHPRTVIKSVMLFVMFVEAVVVLIRQTNHFRVTRALRPVFLLDSHYCRGVRRVFRQTLQSLPPILDMILLLLFLMLIFSILGFYLFSDIPGNTYFATIQDSFISLFVLLTTANYPDVMMPAYNVSRFSALFFISYLVTELYFIMNLLLAVVYDTFSGLEKKKLKKLFVHKREGLRLAFRLLTTKKNPNHITLRAFLGVMQFFKPNNTRKDTYLMFKAMNTEKTGKLSLEEFYKMYDISDLTFKPNSPGADIWSSNFRSPWNKIFKAIHWLINWKFFEGFVYLLIFANFIWIVVETIRISVNNIPVHQYNFAFTYASIFFVSMYCLEASIKILGKGPRQYFTYGWDLFDFVVTITSLVGILGQEFADSFYYITVLRPLRLLRLFKIKKRYRDVLGTLFVLLNRLISLIGLIVLVYYFFAIIGMEVFLNVDLTNCCSNTSVADFYLKDNQSLGHYYLNNFENIFVSGVTLFELTVVNNWFIIMDGYAYHVSQWTRIFFMLFYLVMMVVMTIVVAFILEMFLFRIAYRRKMHLEDIEDDEKYKVDISLDEEEEEMCENTDIIPTGNHIIRQTSSTRPIPFKYRGEKTRTKEDFSLRMYADEVKTWIDEEKSQRQNTIFGMSELRNRQRPNSEIL